MDKEIRYFFHCYNDYVFDYGRSMCELTDLAHRYEKVIISLVPEGADINEIPYKDTKVIKILEDLCQRNSWPKTKFTIEHVNPLQKESTWPSLSYRESMPSFITLMSNDFEGNKSIKYHFGSYVVNSSWPRLWLSSYLYCNHKKIADQTFLRSLKNPAHAVNLDMDNMLFNFSCTGKINDINLKQVHTFLDAVPITKNNRYDMQDQADKHYSGLTKDGDAVNNEILSWYDHIFMDIVYETFYSGEVFYLTEKTARPLFTKTPFIVFGPVNFLKNLKKLGFKTFSKFWSEEYDDFSGVLRLLAIKKLVNTLSELTVHELNELHNNLDSILEHNYSVYRELKFQSIIDKIKA
jgi:hypothetical protein